MGNFHVSVSLKVITTSIGSTDSLGSVSVTLVNEGLSTPGGISTPTELDCR